MLKKNRLELILVHPQNQLIDYKFGHMHLKTLKSKNFYKNNIYEIYLCNNFDHFHWLRFCTQQIFKNLNSKFSMINFDLSSLKMTAMYFATKVVDLITQKFDDFCLQTGKDVSVLVLYELLIMDGVNFNKILDTSYRIVRGMIKKIKDYVQIENLKRRKSLKSIIIKLSETYKLLLEKMTNSDMSEFCSSSISSKLNVILYHGS